jgi:hypothetical protein
MFSYIYAIHAYVVARIIKKNKNPDRLSRSLATLA